MMKCGDKEIQENAMNDIWAENGMDVFDMLLEVHVTTMDVLAIFGCLAECSVSGFCKS